jgi:hypothetical protein
MLKIPMLLRRPNPRQSIRTPTRRKAVVHVDPQQLTQPLLDKRTLPNTQLQPELTARTQNNLTRQPHEIIAPESIVPLQELRR